MFGGWISTANLYEKGFSINTASRTVLTFDYSPPRQYTYAYQQTPHLTLIFTALMMFLGAGEEQNPLLPDGVVLFPQWMGTSWYAWLQTLE